MVKPLLRALAGEALARPPVWLMRQAGRYLPEYRAVRAQVGSFLDLCYNPELAAEVTLQPIRRYGLDAAILFSDILVMPHALGQRVDYVEGEGPKAEPVTDATGIARLSAGRLHEVLGPVYETVRRVSAALPAETALIGFAGAPWTVATYMVEGGGSKEYGVVKRLAYGEPETFGRLVDLLVEATSAYLLRQIQAGAEAVQLFDSSAGVLPPVEFDRWVIAPTKRIVQAVRAQAPGVPIIGFPRGAGLLYERYLAGTGVEAVGMDATVPPAWAARVLQPKAAVQGNLDPVLLLTGGEAMIRAADAIVAALGRGPFVFNLGHGVLQKTHPEHVAALVRHLRRDKA
jgi:uroporphyrinogen decarboxylase